MKKLNFFVPVIAMLFWLTGNVVAQDTNSDSHTVTISIPEVSLLDIEPSESKNITLAVTVNPVEAGSNVNFSATNSTLWLNYTSIVDPNELRIITVAIDAAIPGIDLKVQAADPDGTNVGATGTANGSQLTLSTTAQDIITGIGSCYTGNGTSNGSNLTYALGIQDTNFANLTSAVAGTAVTVTYTMTATD